MVDEPPTFLGRGWAFPPTFTAAGADVVTVSDADDVHECLSILVATTPGERVMRPGFGCDLPDLQFEEVDAGFVNRVRQVVSSAILRGEPRVELNDVNVNTSETEQGVVLIGVDYTIRSSNSRFNMVFPFYVNEARTPGV